MVWNSLVACHTIKQLSEPMQAKVYDHYHLIIALNRLDPNDLAALAKYDPFWLAFTMGDLGIPPMLGPKAAKWFYVPNPRRARTLLFEDYKRNGMQTTEKVARDIHEKYGVLLDLDTLSTE